MSNVVWAQMEVRDAKARQRRECPMIQFASEMKWERDVNSAHRVCWVGEGIERVFLTLSQLERIRQMTEYLDPGFFFRFDVRSRIPSSILFAKGDADVLLKILGETQFKSVDVTSLRTGQKIRNRGSGSCYVIVMSAVGPREPAIAADVLSVTNPAEWELVEP